MLRRALTRRAPGQVPFYVYSSSYNLANRYQASVGNLGGASSAALVAHLGACGIQCQGILEPSPPSLAAYLSAKVALTAADAGASLVMDISPLLIASYARAIHSASCRPTRSSRPQRFARWARRLKPQPPR